LLSAIGSREARSVIEEYGLTPEWYQQRQLEFAGDPCKSSYAWGNDEERLKCLEREDVGVYRVLSEAKLLLIDPSIVVPEFHLSEALRFLQGINPAAIRASSSHTQESHLLELLTPILCAYRPHELGEFMRAVVKTMPDRDLGGPLHLAKHAEARAFSAIAPHLTSSGLFNAWSPVRKMRSTSSLWSYGLRPYLPETLSRLVGFCGKRRARQFFAGSCGHSRTSVVHFLKKIVTVWCAWPILRMQVFERGQYPWQSLCRMKGSPDRL
jgi:hypothetical protein